MKLVLIDLGKHTSLVKGDTPRWEPGVPEDSDDKLVVLRLVGIGEAVNRLQRLHLLSYVI